MIEMRKRAALRKAGDYVSVSKEEDEGDHELHESAPMLGSAHEGAPASSGACAIVCFVFSLSGIIFLSSIATMLSMDYDYIVVQGKKPEVAKSVWEAVAMYAVCCVVSAYYWWRSCRRVTPTVDFDL